ncbi:DUF4177 domain-containing protein [Criibacterium bergeronii]|uniref:DUF4177 domain-containing protein n=1 Tax=Criibacterium bergeronii TaxID=1871336 RepID=A0A371IJ28_9FIRM|nr:DUF4177 domain-containing protein [Criibacterium bergeronii]
MGKNFVEIKSKFGFKVKKGDTLAECKNAILENAQQGWRLKQVVVPFN